MPLLSSNIFEQLRVQQQVFIPSRLELKLVTGESAVSITEDVALSVALARATGVLHQSPAAPVNTYLDISFDPEVSGGYPIATALAYGEIPFIDFITTALATATASGSYANNAGIIADSAIATALAYGSMLLEALKANWIKWSDIGSLTFTIGRNNVAGERPLDWKGTVWKVKKLGNKVVAYGENGVSVLNPVDKFFGLTTISKIGLKGRQAICGDDITHLFINSKGELWKLEDKLELLDYSEYLSQLSSSTVMAYDSVNKMVYIGDETYGFVYSLKDRSLGQGYTGVTGIDCQGGQFYAVGTNFSLPLFYECTDIYDFGTRKTKTIDSIDFGVKRTITENETAVLDDLIYGNNIYGDINSGTGDIIEELYAAIDYKPIYGASFSMTPWTKLTPQGIANTSAFGVEFRFRLKSLIVQDIALEEIKINGYIHNS